jgi:hypothetical protein
MRQPSGVVLLLLTAVCRVGLMLPGLLVSDRTSILPCGGGSVILPGSVAIRLLLKGRLLSAWRLAWVSPGDSTSRLVASPVAVSAVSAVVARWRGTALMIVSCGRCLSVPVVDLRTARSVPGRLLLRRSLPAAPARPLGLSRKALVSVCWRLV